MNLTNPANEIKDPSSANKSSIYSTSRPQYVAKYKRVGFRRKFDNVLLGDDSICNRAGATPLLPNKPKNYIKRLCRSIFLLIIIDIVRKRCP